jgi:uncharacterized protein (TIGR00251 family)
VTPGPPLVKQEGPDVLLAVHVQPRASRNHLAFSSDRIVLRLTAPPVDGAANAACRAFLAERLDVAKSRITILRGDTARAKLIRIRDADAAAILSRLQPARRENGSR